jgi:Cu+-exporting ATPase
MTAVPSAGARVVTDLLVGGMHCSNCSRHVEKALAEIDGVDAAVDLPAAIATVTHPASVAVETLVAAVDEAGYEVAVRA